MQKHTYAIFVTVSFFKDQRVQGILFVTAFPHTQQPKNSKTSLGWLILVVTGCYKEKGVEETQILYYVICTRPLTKSTKLHPLRPATYFPGQNAVYLRYVSVLTIAQFCETLKLKITSSSRILLWLHFLKKTPPYYIDQKEKLKGLDGFKSA